MRKLYAAVLLLVVCAPVTLAGQTCKPVTGHFLASIVPPGQEFCPNLPNQFCTAGRVWGGIQGQYQFVMSAQYPAALLGGTPSVLFFTGKSDITLGSGDHVFGTDTGSIDLQFLGGQGGFASLITFNGGTGPMSTASGQIRLRGQFDPAAGATGETSGDYTGTLCSQ
jgi:hypothetical protein